MSLSYPPPPPAKALTMCEPKDQSESRMANLHLGSRDYYHAPWGQLLLILHTKCMEMTTLGDKIACCSCTACPPAIVLRLFIADTIISATVYSQCVKVLRTQQKHGKFYRHDCGTTARPNKNRLTRLILRQLAKMTFPGFN